MSSHESDLSGFDAHNQRPGWHVAVEVAGTAAVALILDNARGIFERMQESHVEAEIPLEPIVHRANIPTSRAVILGTGCDQNQAIQASRAAELFGDMAHVITPAYGKYDIGLDSVANQIVDASEELGVDEAVFWGGSMGFGILMRAATNRRLRRHFPEARGVIGNAPVLRQTNIAENCLAVLGAARFTRYSSMTNRLYKAVYDLSGEPHNFGDVSIKIPRIPKMPPREISRYATALQGPLPNGCLYGFVDPANLYVLDNREGEDYRDRVAKIWLTCRDIEDVFGFTSQIVRDPLRPAHSHCAGLQLPTLAEPVTLPQQLVGKLFFGESKPEIEYTQQQAA